MSRPKVVRLPLTRDQQVLCEENVHLARVYLASPRGRHYARMYRCRDDALGQLHLALVVAAREYRAERGPFWPCFKQWAFKHLLEGLGQQYSVKEFTEADLGAGEVSGRKKPEYATPLVPDHVHQDAGVCDAIRLAAAGGSVAGAARDCGVKYGTVYSAIKRLKLKRLKLKRKKETA